MFYKSNKHWWSPGRLVRGTSILAVVALCAPLTAWAQQEDSDAVSDGALDEIVVTSTRVIRDGYNSPTPTSILGAEEINTKAPANIADFVNELPSLAAAQTPRSNITFVSAGLVGINALNLRNIGENRTLVLLDGQRVGAATLTGWVDVNQFPQALIERVDVVTGGASASWGSDAVAGVVNFVLDKDFTGIKSELQAGVTTYGDDQSFKVSLAAGTRFADDRGHFMISGEVADNAGITGIGDRNWNNGAKIVGNPDYTPTNGEPQLLSTRNVGYIATPGGFVNTGPNSGTYFGPGGTPLQLNVGTVTGINMIGGDWEITDISETGDLHSDMTRHNIFARTSYDVSENFQIFAQGSYSRATANNNSISYLSFFNQIAADNAFLPAGIAGGFALSTFAFDLGLVTANTERESTRWVVGANGEFDAMGSSWNWEFYAQTSANDSLAETRIPVTQNWRDAIDAVRDPNGTIVCRTTLTDPTDGCVPFNPFGTGVNSQVAADYVMGNAFGINNLEQDVYAVTFYGTPFSTWAGEVDIATGVEHRRESVTGSNDPLRDAAIAAGEPPPYFAGNYLASEGSYDVTEGFLEAVLPLAQDSSLADNLDLNLGVRITNYSTSGSVETWKVGVNYAPIEDIRFRVTRSRDIRAPNLGELFQSGQTSTQIITDPENGGASVTTFQTAGGNPNLVPEEADTLGVGMVLQPSFLPGFAASVDYYEIDISGAISSVDAQTIVNECSDGTLAFCDLIERDASNMITGINVSPVNFANQTARGIDFEASYQRPVGSGELGIRLLATHYLENFFDNGISAPTDTVGTNGYNIAAKNALPDWKYLATVRWDSGPIGLSLTARGFSDGVQNSSWIECTSNCPASTSANQTINDNQLPGEVYFDTNFTYRVSDQIDAYLSVDNILDTDPAEAAYGPGIGIAPLAVNTVLYDTLGRKFRLGVRMAF